MILKLFPHPFVLSLSMARWFIDEMVCLDMCTWVFGEPCRVCVYLNGVKPGLLDGRCAYLLKSFKWPTKQLWTLTGYVIYWWDGMLRYVHMRFGGALESACLSQWRGTQVSKWDQYVFAWEFWTSPEIAIVSQWQDTVWHEQDVSGTSTCNSETQRDCHTLSLVRWFVNGTVVLHTSSNHLERQLEHQALSMARWYVNEKGALCACTITFTERKGPNAFSSAGPTNTWEEILRYVHRKLRGTRRSSRSFDRSTMLAWKGCLGYIHTWFRKLERCRCSLSDKTIHTY
jgi:hypothetical protein